jgi:gamma-glutamylcyclotransferase (GGCT)/AIG2-like uncharacterized protein YtfP
VNTETLPSSVPAAVPTASDLSGATQPLTPETALAQIDALKGDKEFYGQLKSQDAAVKAAAMARWTKLHQVAHSVPTQVASEEDVNQQAAARNAEEWNRRIVFLNQFFPVTAEHEAEIRGGVIRADLHAKVIEEIHRLANDRGFYEDYKRGSVAAREKWHRLIEARGLRPVPVK